MRLDYQQQIQQLIPTRVELEKLVVLTPAELGLIINFKTPADVLDYLAQRLISHHDHIQAIAQHPNCAGRTLAYLVTYSQSASVRIEAIAHPNCPGSTLDQSADSKYEGIRAAAGRHPRCPIKKLIKLSSDAQASVRMAVAGNVRIPAHVVIRLAADPSPLVSAQALLHRRCPDHIKTIVALGRS